MYYTENIEEIKCVFDCTHLNFKSTKDNCWITTEYTGEVTIRKHLFDHIFTLELVNGMPMRMEVDIANFYDLLKVLDSLQLQWARWQGSTPDLKFSKFKELVIMQGANELLDIVEQLTRCWLSHESMRLPLNRLREAVGLSSYT